MARPRKDAPPAVLGGEEKTTKPDALAGILGSRRDPIARIVDPADAGDTDDDGRVTGDEYRADGTRARIGIGRDPALRRRSEKRTLRRMLREEAAAEQIDRLPDEGEEILLLLSGRWHGFDLFGAIMRLGAPAKIAEAHVSSLAINKTHTRRLEEMLDEGEIGRLTLVVADVFREKSKSEWSELQRVFGADPARRRVAAVRNHTKLMAIRLTDGRCYAVHGSLNLRRCSSYEQASISRDRGDTAYAFLRDFIEEIAAEGGR